MDQLLNKWKLVLQAIAQQLPTETFNTWFNNNDVVFDGVRDDEVQLIVPNNFFYEYLVGNYKAMMLAEVYNVFGLSNINISVKREVEARNATASQQSNSQSTELVGKPSRPVFQSHLSPNYTFDNFVKGEANKLAHSIALTIATKPHQTAFNPFLIYGDSGVGKSHLVNALGLKMLETFPEHRVLYISAHDFLMQYVDSVPKNKFNDFMYFYQSIDCLIIDDIHEISGKPKTQEVLFNIFNHLQRNGRQIIFTTDKEPAKLVGFEERVSSRFTMGATVELQRPDEQLRINILKAKIRKNQLNIPREVIKYIAENVTGNVRDLEGVLNSLLVESIIYNCDVNLEMTQKIVTKLVRFSNKTITLSNIINAVCRYYKVTQKDINSSSRKANIVRARQVSMYLAQKHTSMSSTQIGVAIGRRDHSTVLHSCNQIDMRIKKNPSFKEEIRAIEQEMIK